MHKELIDLRGKVISLPPTGSWPRSRHRFDEESVWAVQAAISTGRPLLIRGRPGAGKSQLARAVAVAAQVPFLSLVIHERTERDDLLFGYDSVARLAAAQVAGIACKDDENWREGLKEEYFVRPGPLWWALNWSDAAEWDSKYRTRGKVGGGSKDKAGEANDPVPWHGADRPRAEAICGPVILVDEIDKADPSVPNGLLEALGNEGFDVQQPSIRVRRKGNVKPPLVMVTTNEERELPSAFLRRCLVHSMEMPSDWGKAEAFLVERAHVHFTEADVSSEVCKLVAGRLKDDREAAARVGGHEPGPAEYLDVIRALVEIAGPETDGDRRRRRQEEVFAKIRKFAFVKHRTEAQ